jgi:hypothetical protein
VRIDHLPGAGIGEGALIQPSAGGKACARNENITAGETACNCDH